MGYVAFDVDAFIRDAATVATVEREDFEVSASTPATLATTATLEAKTAEVSQKSQLSQGSVPEQAPQTAQTVASVAAVSAACLVPPEEVAMLCERIVDTLMQHGRSRREAEVEAMPALRTRLANDPRLAPMKQPFGRCTICGGPETGDDTLLPVMTGKPDVMVWLHAGDCHRAHVATVTAKVDAVLAAAGVAT